MGSGSPVLRVDDVENTFDSLLRGRKIRRLHRSADGALLLSRSGHSPASRALLPVASTREIGILAPACSIYLCCGSFIGP